MHVPDGFLAVVISLVLWAVVIVVVAYALLRVSRDMGERQVRAAIGPVFLAYLLPLLLALVYVPLLLYQLFALRTAFYSLSRDGLQLRWGLRNEVVPITNINGIGLLEDLTSKPPGPIFRLPGAWLGTRNLPGEKKPGESTAVEYLAAGGQGLVFIGTQNRIFAITPKEPLEFIYAFNQLMEMGSLSPFSARTVYPSVLVIRIWSSKVARWMLISSLFFSVGLLVWIGFVVPGRPTIHFGFDTTGAPGDIVPGVRLLLLPVVNAMIVLVDWLVGLGLFRREDSKTLAYVIWGSAVLIPVLFIIGTFFILQRG